MCGSANNQTIEIDYAQELVLHKFSLEIEEGDSSKSVSLLLKLIKKH